MSVLNTAQLVTADRQRLVASDLNLLELKLRLAARVAARHDREPSAVWSREEIARVGHPRADRLALRLGLAPSTVRRQSGIGRNLSADSRRRANVAH